MYREFCLSSARCTDLRLVEIKQLWEWPVSLFSLVKACFISEMEKRADGADASVLFFSLGCANFLDVYAQIR